MAEEPINDGGVTSQGDTDPIETQEWLDALSAVVASAGAARARYLLQRLNDEGRHLDLVAAQQPYSAYRNTIGLDKQPPFPGDEAMEERLTGIMRWNALAMVMRANEAFGEVGGHIASYASAAEIFETGFNHFFRGHDAPDGADLVFFQPHSAPGIYARAFLEGRLPESRLARYRQETGEHGGLCSYPHPWLMPNFWQFPTGSMGIGLINAIYQARFMRYLEHRRLTSMGDRHVWGVFGDGEMDEPESVAGLTFAARERLDNLTFVINCNLQRLNGPVRGNGQIIQELEGLFAGAGWNVIKVLWGSEWDELFARDTNHALLRRFAATTDGEYQTLGAKDGSYNLANFFNQDPELRSLVAHMTDAQVDALRRGGHDMRKLFAAFATARAHKGAPSVILAKTKKGYGMGPTGESRMVAHQTKKLKAEGLLAFRDRFALPLTDAEVESLQFYRPPDGSPEHQYLMQRRAELGGPLPQRAPSGTALKVPATTEYAPVCNGGRAQANVHHHGVRAHVEQPVERRGAGPAHRADRGRRGAHLRHGQPVSPGRHLFPVWVSCTSRKIPNRWCRTKKPLTARFWRRASPRPAPCLPGSQPPRRTVRTASPCCRFTSTIPCLVFSAWAI